MDKQTLIYSLEEAIGTMEKMLSGLNPYYSDEPETMRETDIILGMRDDWGIAWHALNTIKSQVMGMSEEMFDSEEIQETYGRFIDMDYGDDDDLDDEFNS